MSDAVGGPPPGSVHWPSPEDPTGWGALTRIGWRSLLNDRRAVLAALAGAAGAVAYCALLLDPTGWTRILPAGSHATALGGALDLFATGGAWGRGSLAAAAVPAALLVGALWPAGRGAWGVLLTLAAAAVCHGLWVRSHPAVGAEWRLLGLSVGATLVLALACYGLDRLLRRRAGIGLLHVNAALAVVLIARQLPPHGLLWLLVLAGFLLSLWLSECPRFRLTVLLRQRHRWSEGAFWLRSDPWPLHRYILHGTLALGLALTLLAGLFRLSADAFGAGAPSAILALGAVGLATFVGTRAVPTVSQTAGHVAGVLQAAEHAPLWPVPSHEVVGELRAELRRAELLALVGLPLWLAVSFGLVLAAPRPEGHVVGPLMMLLAVMLVAEAVRTTRARLREGLVWRALRPWVASPRVPTASATESWMLAEVAEHVIDIAWRDEGARRGAHQRLRQAGDGGHILGTWRVLAEGLWQVFCRSGAARVTAVNALVWGGIGLAVWLVLVYAVGHFAGLPFLAGLAQQEVATLLLVSFPIFIVGRIVRFVLRLLQASAGLPPVGPPV